MKILIFFALCYQYILAAHLEYNRIDLKEVKTKFENLLDDSIQEIMNHLDEKSQEYLSKSAKGYFKYDPRIVELNFPLQNSKEPTPFVCNHFKMRKKLVIGLKNDIGDIQLFGPESLNLKYLKCLSGIEVLDFGEKIDATRILADSNFKIQELFPKLKTLIIKLTENLPLNAIPNNLKSLKLYFFTVEENQKLKEKISQMKQLENLHLIIIKDSTSLSSMVSELKHLPLLKRLVIDYYGSNLHYIGNIISQTSHAQYFINLALPFVENNIGNFFEYLTDRIETLDMRHIRIDDPANVCAALPKLIHLKKLTLNPKNFNGDFGCLFHSLPPSLAEFSFGDSLKNSNADKIVLPKTLQSVYLYDIKSKVFEALANHVEILKAKISDSENFLAIKKPFTRVKSLVVANGVYSWDLKYWLHLIDLLPMNMDLVYFEAYFKRVEEFYILEEKILKMKNRVNRFIFTVYALPLSFTREYIFNGSKMVKKE